ncbi:MAG: radical SAM family heme chaperone HemW [Verrucomicrobiae bacterium]|nr:radical SAM family heme chaperone HemW [Verrucomicrobiae bacterium]
MPNPFAHLYVHIPFCVAKCAYCAFYSEPAEERRAERFLAALEREIEAVAGRLAPQTIYIGGGTPTSLTAEQLERLLTHLRACIPNLESRVTSRDFEWTVETNPATLTSEKARLLRLLGVNRVSVGAQALDDALLERLGRVHTVAMIHETVETLRTAGFENLNLDFIFAIPGQTVAQWGQTLRRAIAMRPQHLSTYELTYEDDTPLLRRLEEEGAARTDEETTLAMYELLLAVTAEGGFAQYEVSNFALPGRECRHNLNYWRGGEYVGIGPSASGLVDGWRYKNVSNSDAYIQRIEHGQAPVECAERLTPRARAGELAAFALRMNEGIAAAAFERQTGFELDQLWARELADLTAQGLIEWDGERLRLTARGRLIADRVAESFIIVDKTEVGSHHPAYGH